MVYVFDTRKKVGATRLPKVLARLLCHIRPHMDYWHTAEGWCPR